MNMTVRLQLSIMMFIQFFVWGAWYVNLWTYLQAGRGFNGDEIGLAFSAAAWAAIVSPFFIGMVADRFFDAEKILGILHLIGGCLMWYASSIDKPGLFFGVILAYTLAYMPTLALVNAISFNQMEDPGKEFPSVRVFGTLGWIVAGLFISFLEYTKQPVFENIEATNIPIKIASIASFLMGIYSFALPKTPPRGAGQTVTVKEILGLEALSLMKNRSFAVFVFSSLLICIPLSFYYAGANAFLNELEMDKVIAKMTMGQMSEVFFMLILPLFLYRVGMKYTLLIGMLAWVARYFLFAFGDADSLVFMLYVGILLHGICYDFFFVSGQIYVDKKAPSHLRASAQGFIGLVTYGIGMAIGTILAGRVIEHYVISAEGEKVLHNWHAIWLVPAVMALVVAAGFLFLFNDKVKVTEEEAR